MQVGDHRPGPGALAGSASLHKSNDKVAAQLVPHIPASYARALLWEQGSERGGEWLRKGLGPDNNNSLYTKKNNWAAFARPIFLRFRAAWRDLSRTAIPQELS